MKHLFDQVSYLRNHTSISHSLHFLFSMSARETRKMKYERVKSWLVAPLKCIGFTIFKYTVANHFSYIEKHFNHLVMRNNSKLKKNFLLYYIPPFFCHNAISQFFSWAIQRRQKSINALILTSARNLGHARLSLRSYKNRFS